MSRRVYIVDKRHNDGWWTILAAGAILAYGQQIGIIAITIAIPIIIAWVMSRYVQARKDINAAKEANEAAIRMRADHENMLANMGDPAGVHGGYDAYTMPMTMPEWYSTGGHLPAGYIIERN